MMNENSLETIVPQDKIIVSRTDLTGNITYVNDTFCQISAYKTEELIGKNHNILRHPDMPKEVFANLWATLKEGKQWIGTIKNLRKDGGYYWVEAIVGLIKEEKKIVGYKSLRSPISNEETQVYTKIYKKMKEQE